MRVILSEIEFRLVLRSRTIKSELRLERNKYPVVSLIVG